MNTSHSNLLGRPRSRPIRPESLRDELAVGAYIDSEPLSATKQKCSICRTPFNIQEKTVEYVNNIIRSDSQLNDVSCDICTESREQRYYFASCLVDLLIYSIILSVNDGSVWFALMHKMLTIKWAYFVLATVNSLFVIFPAKHDCF